MGRATEKPTFLSPVSIPQKVTEERREKETANTQNTSKSFQRLKFALQKGSVLPQPFLHIITWRRQVTSDTKGGEMPLGKVPYLKLLITCSSSRQSDVAWVLLPFPNCVSTAAAAPENCRGSHCGALHC